MCHIIIDANVTLWRFLSKFQMKIRTWLLFAIYDYYEKFLNPMKRLLQIDWYVATIKTNFTIFFF
jgi:hypothetical protein